MNYLRTLRYVSVFVLLGSQLSFADVWINGLKGVPRLGNNRCWSDTGGRVKNVCPTTQLLSFMPEIDVLGKTVAASVFTDAPFAGLSCQSVALNSNPTNYWTLGPKQSNAWGLLTIPAWQPPWTFNFYQIDCQVPAGVQIFGVSVAVF